MKYLSFTLDKILNLMTELEILLQEEVKQLSGLKINPISLQIISDGKSKLLATISHYDDLRKEQENVLNLAAPYSSHIPLNQIWDKIAVKIKQSNHLNQNVYGLLDIHMQRMSSLKEIVNKAGANTSVYGSSGYSDANSPGKIYNVSI